MVLFENSGHRSTVQHHEAAHKDGTVAGADREARATTHAGSLSLV